MLVVFAGGGTGGHLYPGVAVARALADVDPSIEVEFWGSGRALEAEILKKENLPSRALPAAPMPKSPLAVPRFLWSVITGYLTARRLLKTRGAVAVVALGGYSSYAPARAARSLGLPVILLEQNAVPGKAIMKLARRATLTCLSWQATAAHMPFGSRAETTGNPLRRRILDAAARFQYSPSGGILVLGGSTGAIGLNTLVTGAARDIAALGRPIVHQTGSADVERVRSAYAAAGVPATVLAYIDDMPAAYRAAALVVARAGGTTLSELALFGLPSILIPYPHHEDYHQMKNARIFADVGAALIIEEKSSSPADLASAVTKCLSDSSELQAMRKAARSLGRPEAAETVASRILELVAKNVP
jgi:UDP-N-acetylglucosamine--N-acetylmuramyl-(pentapeptide) pyrophosphoryl-undecaprenol N-acetylglucosamine transferase